MCYSLPCFYLTLEYAAQLFSPCRPDFLSVLEWEAGQRKSLFGGSVVVLSCFVCLFCFLKKPFSLVDIR